jgi:hypothetical protein
MAAWLNKWLFLFLLPIGLYISGKIPLQESSSNRGAEVGEGLHPFHVSVVEINHNAAEKTFEISCKIFTDDFEKVLAQNYPQAAHRKIDLINPPDKKAMDTLVKKYISAHLSIVADGRPVQLTYLGFERENEAVYSYVQADHLPSVKKIEITNKLMYDLFTDQVNLVHVVVGGNRKSTKLDYPASVAVISF